MVTIRFPLGQSSQVLFNDTHQFAGQPIGRLADVDDPAVAQLVQHASRWRALVSASEDLTVRVWDTQNGHVLAVFTGDASFTNCRISASGPDIVATDSAGRVHFLRLEGPASSGPSS